jgi:hypothetical protein
MGKFKIFSRNPNKNFAAGAERKIFFAILQPSASDLVWRGEEKTEGTVKT